MAVESLFERSGRFTMISAWAPQGRAVVNHTTFEEGGKTCVVGVNGRGSLQVTEPEFLELYEAMCEAVAVLRGKDPTTKEDPRG